MFGSGIVVDLKWRTDLLKLAGIENCNAVAEFERLFLIMRNEY